MEKTFLKIYGIENLQNIFVQGFIYKDFLLENNNKEVYIIEINVKATKKSELLNILDIEKVYFRNNEELLNFKTTSYRNLPVLEHLLEINSLIFKMENKYFEYENKINQKFENNYFNKINIDIKLGFFSSLFYYFSLEKRNPVNINGFLNLLNIKKIDDKFELINLMYSDIFSKAFKNKVMINQFIKEAQFKEASLIYHIFSLFLNGKKIERRSFENKEENQLSILSKILYEINKTKQTRNESHEVYIGNILEKLNLDFYEKSNLQLIRGKNIKNAENLLELFIIMLIKGNFNSIIENITIFEIKDELQEHVIMLCYALRGILDGYKNLEKEIKKYAYYQNIFNIILNKKNRTLEFDGNSIKYSNLILNIN